MTTLNYICLGFGILFILPLVKWAADKLIEIVCVALLLSSYFVVVSISWVWNKGRSSIRRISSLFVRLCR